MPRRQGQAPLSVKDLSNHSSELPGGLSRLRHKEEVAEDFSGSESKRELKMDMMTSSNPTCPRGLRWGHPHSTDSLILPEDLFQLHCGVVRASTFSGGPHLLEAPDSCLGSQLLCKKWVQSSSELLWFLN